MSRGTRRLVRLLKVGSAVGATAAVGGHASQDVATRWYDDLEKPSFQPPDTAFPVAWSLLYTDIVLSCGHALDRLDEQGLDEEAAAYRRALAVNLVLNAGWSWVFFNRHRLGPAVGVAGALALSGADLVRRTRRVSPAAALALAPYPAWCAFATALSTEIWRRNR